MQDAVTQCDLTNLHQYEYYNNFERLVEKRRIKILENIKFDIRNYIFLFPHQIANLRHLTTEDMISIIVLYNETFQHYIATMK